MKFCSVFASHQRSYSSLLRCFWHVTKRWTHQTRFSHILFPATLEIDPQIAVIDSRCKQDAQVTHHIQSMQRPCLRFISHQNFSDMFCKVRITPLDEFSFTHNDAFFCRQISHTQDCTVHLAICFSPRNFTACFFCHSLIIILFIEVCSSHDGYLAAAAAGRCLT